MSILYIEFVVLFLIAWSQVVGVANESNPAFIKRWEGERGVPFTSSIPLELSEVVIVLT
jgi:hypothetical protein